MAANTKPKITTNTIRHEASRLISRVSHAVSQASRRKGRRGTGGCCYPLFRQLSNGGQRRTVVLLIADVFCQCTLRREVRKERAVQLRNWSLRKREKTANETNDSERYLYMPLNALVDYGPEAYFMSVHSIDSTHITPFICKLTQHLLSRQ